MLGCWTCAFDVQRSASVDGDDNSRETGVRIHRGPTRTVGRSFRCYPTIHPVGQLQSQTYGLFSQCAHDVLDNRSINFASEQTTDISQWQVLPRKHEGYSPHPLFPINLPRVRPPGPR